MDSAFVFVESKAVKYVFRGFLEFFLHHLLVNAHVWMGNHGTRFRIIGKKLLRVSVGLAVCFERMTEDPIFSWLHVLQTSHPLDGAHVLA